MPNIRLVPVEGITDGAVDPDKDLITFSFRVGGQKTAIPFVAPPNVIEQMAMSLAGLVKGLQEAKKSLGVPFSPQPIHAERVVAYGVQREAFAQAVLIHFETESGVPYTFAVPTARASEIAARLQTEAAKPNNSGTA